MNPEVEALIEANLKRQRERAAWLAPPQPEDEPIDESETSKEPEPTEPEDEMPPAGSFDNGAVSVPDPPRDIGAEIRTAASFVSRIPSVEVRLDDIEGEL